MDSWGKDMLMDVGRGLTGLSSRRSNAVALVVTWHVFVLLDINK